MICAKYLLEFGTRIGEEKVDGGYFFAGEGRIKQHNMHAFEHFVRFPYGYLSKRLSLDDNVRAGLVYPTTVECIVSLRRSNAVAVFPNKRLGMWRTM